MPVLKELSIPLPSIEAQKAIAHILGTLDDKIELTRKTNETLEAMAKALFKSWFVDFDPVRAKAEGCPTGLPAEISDLFPDSFEDSELGEIPSGWAVTNVGEVTDLVTKGTTPTSIGGAFTGEGIPFYKVESISDERHVIPGKCAFIDDRSDALLARSRIEEGDILFSIAGTIGRVAQMTRFDIPANTNQALAIARPGKRRISSALLFHFLRERGRIDLALSRTVQSVQASFSLSELKSIPLALPQQSSRGALEDIFDSLRKKISSNQRNSFSVSALRDALLPKLISGEIRIPDAEKMLEEVGV
jgi:type I restriction enzyme S subunit